MKYYIISKLIKPELKLLKNEIKNLQIYESTLESDEKVKLDVRQALMVTQGTLIGYNDIDNTSIKLSTLDMIREKVTVTLTAVEQTKYLSISQEDLEIINKYLTQVLNQETKEFDLSKIKVIRCIGSGS